MNERDLDLRLRPPDPLASGAGRAYRKRNVNLLRAITSQETNAPLDLGEIAFDRSAAPKRRKRSTDAAREIVLYVTSVHDSSLGGTSLVSLRIESVFAFFTSVRSWRGYETRDERRLKTFVHVQSRVICKLCSQFTLYPVAGPQM